MHKMAFSHLVLSLPVFFFFSSLNRKSCMAESSGSRVKMSVRMAPLFTVLYAKGPIK